MRFSALLPYLTPHRRVLLLIVLLLLAGSATALLQPWLAGQLTAALLGEAARWSAGQVLGLWLVVLLARSVLEFAGQYHIGSTGEALAAALRSRLFQHLQALPIAWFRERRRGDVLTLLSNDADQVSAFVTGTLVQLLPLLVTFGGALLAMLWLDPLIALLAGTLLPLYFLVMKVLGRRLRPLSRAWIDAYSALVSFLDEHLEMKPAIKSFVREPLEAQQFDRANSVLLHLSRRQLLVQSLLGPLVGLLAGLGLLLLFWVGSGRIASGALAPADLVSLLLYAMLMSQPLRGLADVYGQVQQTRGAAQRILDYLAAQPEPEDTGNPDLPPVRGDIRFESVSFRYPGGNPVLQDLSLHIAAGETVAVTGPNGAGKSTLAHLLQRLADPEGGRILVDGTDIRTVSLASLRRQVGLVAQHTLLLNGTVAENIAYGAPLVSKGQIEAAARSALAHDFISALPEGYQTLVGDQGVRLSGGQRQRLALARTLLLDPPVLILDEATSMLDPAGEAGLVETCRDILAGRTVLLITHRPAALALADRVVELALPG